MEYSLRINALSVHTAEGTHNRRLLRAFKYPHAFQNRTLFYDATRPQGFITEKLSWNDTFHRLLRGSAYETGLLRAI